MVSKEEQLRGLIMRLTSLRFRPPVFTDGLEQEFAEDATGFRSKRQALETSISLTLYFAVIASNEVFTVHGHRLQSELRFAFVMPALLFLNLVQWFRPSPPRVIDRAILIVSIAAGTFETLSHLLVNGGYGYRSQLAIVAVLVFVNTVMRVRLSYAVVTFGWCAVMECLCVAFATPASLNFSILQAALVVAIGLLTVVANYSQDREARLAFLKYVQKREMVGNLAQTNLDLAAAALTDGLTGLANRTSLDQHLAELWSADRGASGECSIIMVDIDHFKDINDRYGHLYGDRVLKRVARLLSEALRGQYDFIARFGGEEFAVILPDTTLDSAMRVAERLRGLVELAGLPSLRTHDPDLGGLRATISCGVATGAPKFVAEPYAVLNAADEALYLAKSAGRNAVRERALQVDPDRKPTSSTASGDSRSIHCRGVLRESDRPVIG